MLPFKNILLFAAAFGYCSLGLAQEEKKSLVIELAYHVKNNQFPYLTVATKVKEEKKLTAVPAIDLQLFIHEELDEMMLGKVKTDRNGRAYLSIAPQFKHLWDSLNTARFVAVSGETKLYEASTAEITITKAKIFIDTLEDAETRTLTATVFEQQGSTTLPAKEVEVKIIVQRMAGNLSVGEEEFYTTDTAGVATAEFKRDSIPGDKEGFITIIAKTEDNDTYGNISIEKKLRWGAAFKPTDDFNRRTLFATRDKSPVWLLFLAYSIAAGVWLTIIYLVLGIARMRKAGLKPN